MIIWSAGRDELGDDSAVFETRADAVDYMVGRLRQIGDDYSSGWFDPEQGDHSKEYWDAADALAAEDGEEAGDWYASFEDGRVAFRLEAADLPEDDARGYLQYDDEVRQRMTEASARSAASRE